MSNGTNLETGIDCIQIWGSLVLEDFDYRALKFNAYTSAHSKWNRRTAPLELKEDMQISS